MNQLTANDLKIRGIGAIEAVLADQTEATISVRGKERFVKAWGHVKAWGQVLQSRI